MSGPIKHGVTARSPSPVPSGASAGRSSCHHTPCASDRTSLRSCQSSGSRPRSCCPGYARRQPDAASRRSLQACSFSLTCRYSSKIRDIGVDQFNGGGANGVADGKRLHVTKNPIFLLFLTRQTPKNYTHGLYPCASVYLRLNNPNYAQPNLRTITVS